VFADVFPNNPPVVFVLLAALFPNNPVLVFVFVFVFVFVLVEAFPNNPPP